MKHSAILLILALALPGVASAEQALPNILWLTSEDNGPHLGCYGDEFADTPNIDSLAAKGVIYLNAWSTAPVCAPARTTLISGMYPPSTGSQHMRSMTRLPERFKMYPQMLRELGYYCTNNSKEDYNLQKPAGVWDESGRKAHWKNRKPGQPFFAVFNYTISHESKLRTRPHKAIHEASKVRVPAYHPDTPDVRRDWAQYYDKVTQMDGDVGRALKELEEAGLNDNTIIFYYGDHGSGMPRSKRWPYNSGLLVPLVVHIPEKYKALATPDYQAGGKTNRLVGFVDFAATLLSLAGKKPPEHFQGHAFLGKFATKPQPYIYGFRGRMDERYDMVRTVRNQRYIYIRNYMPHEIYGQYIAYMFQTPTTRVWKEMFDAGKLNAAQSKFWQTKPAEELYDLQTDPDEVNNLAGSKEHADILKELRAAQRGLAVKIRDLGFLPEGEIHRRAGDDAPYTMGHDKKRYPLERILAAAETATMPTKNATTRLITAARDKDSAVRYWALLGLSMRGKAGVKAGRDTLRNALGDSAPDVRIAAAEGLARYGDKDDLNLALPVLIDAANLETQGVFTSMAALNAIDTLDGKAASLKPQIQKLPRRSKAVNGRMKSYVGYVLDKFLADLILRGR